MILSTAAKIENDKIKSNYCSDMVTEYINLPDLPYDNKINIKKIGVYNWNPINCIHSGHCKYSLFSDIDIHSYPIGKCEAIDYMPDDQVSPVVIIDINDIKYKTNMLLWFPLTDLYTSILCYQQKHNRKFFPIKIKIDKDNQWIVPLVNRLK